MQLAMARFRKDRLSMIAFIIVAIYCGIAIVAPFLVKFGVLDPLSFHQDLLDANMGGIPEGSLGGISADHWLGVEPGTGRDVFARMVYGITWSLFIALSATFVAMTIGTVLGIIGGFTGGFTDSVIGRRDRPDPLVPQHPDAAGHVGCRRGVPDRHPRTCPRATPPTRST